MTYKTCKNKIKTFRYTNNSKKTQFEIWDELKNFDIKNKKGAFVYEPFDGDRLPSDIDGIFEFAPDTKTKETVRNKNVVRKYNIKKILKKA